MDVAFQKNNLKPGDPGFQYDKRVDFTRKSYDQQLDVQDSWDEDEEDGEGVDDYFDDDFQ